MIYEYRVVTNGKVFRVQFKGLSTGEWSDALWVDYPTREAAEKKMHELQNQPRDVWEPVN